MRVLWTLVKIIVGLAVLIPLCIVVLAVSLGIFGALMGLAIMALRLAVFGLLAYGAFKLVGAMFGGRKRTAAPELKPLPPVDPYYEQAKRELDRELGHGPTWSSRTS